MGVQLNYNAHISPIAARGKSIIIAHLHQLASNCEDGCNCEDAHVTQDSPVNTAALFEV